MRVKSSAHFTEMSRTMQQLAVEIRNAVSKIFTFSTTKKLFCNMQTSQIYWGKVWTTVQICAFIRRAAVKFKVADWNSNKMLDVPSKEDYAERCVSAYPGRPDSSTRTATLTKPQQCRIFIQSNLTECHSKVCEESPLVTLCCQLHWWGLLWGKFSGRPLRSWGIRRCLGGLFILPILSPVTKRIINALTGIKTKDYRFFSYCSISSH